MTEQLPIPLEKRFKIVLAADYTSYAVEVIRGGFILKEISVPLCHLPLLLPLWHQRPNDKQLDNDIKDAFACLGEDTLFSSQCQTLAVAYVQLLNSFFCQPERDTTLVETEVVKDPSLIALLQESRVLQAPAWMVDTTAEMSPLVEKLAEFRSVSRQMMATLARGLLMRK